MKHCKILLYFTLQVAAESVDVGVVPAEDKHVANVVPAVHAFDDPHLHVAPVQILSSPEDPQASASPHLHVSPAAQLSEFS